MPLKKFIDKSKKILIRVRNKVQSLSKNDLPYDKNLKTSKLPEEKSQAMTVEISLWSSAKIILIVLGFLILQKALLQIAGILLIFFISLFLAAAFNPGVDWFEQKLKFPRPLGIIVLYIFVLGILSFIIGGVVPIIINQISDMATSLKDYLNNFIRNENTDSGLLGRFKTNIEGFLNQIDQKQLIESVQKYLQTIASNLASFAGNAFGIVFKVVNGIFNFILILLLTFFMVTEKNELNKFFTSLFPRKYEKYIYEKAHMVQIKIGDWVHGQIALFFIMGIITFIGLKIIGIIALKAGFVMETADISKYALTLALVAGLAEFLPYVGPMLAFATAAPVAFNDSLLIGVIVIGFYGFLQMLEGNIIVPLVMKKAMGLSPIVTIIAMLAGWQFLGIWGMILSIPLASIISIFVGDFTGRKNR